MSVPIFDKIKIISNSMGMKNRKEPIYLNEKDFKEYLDAVLPTGGSYSITDRYQFKTHPIIQEGGEYWHT